MGKDLKARKEYVWKKQIQNFVLSLLRHALIYIYILYTLILIYVVWDLVEF